MTNTEKIKEYKKELANLKIALGKRTVTVNEYSDFVYQISQMAKELIAVNTKEMFEGTNESLNKISILN